MEQKDLLLQFFRMVAGRKKHKHYAHTVEKRKLYRQLVLGEGIDELLRKFVKRESPELFAQRVNITQHITPAICENLLDTYTKIPRSNSSLRILNHGASGNLKTERLEEVLNKFWGKKSFDDFVNDRVIELNSTDPNAFVVIEWGKFDGATERIAPYPRVASSPSVMDFAYENDSILEYLTVRRPHRFRIDSLHVQSLEDQIIKPEKDTKDGHAYTLYGKLKTWTLTEISETDAHRSTDVFSQGEMAVDAEGRKITKLGSSYFIFNDELKPHGLGSVPAFRVGYLKDKATNGETFVNPLHSIEPYLMKTIKVNSEFDLVATLLALPQMVKYGQQCIDKLCFGGEYSNGTECPTCKGDGVKATAPSAQDAIVLPTPRTKEEMMPLSEFIKYIHPPVEIVEFQRDYVQQLTGMCKLMLFNEDQFDKKQVADTATGRVLDIQNVYDKLFPLAVKLASVWNFGVYAVANLADLEKGLVARFTYNKDFKLKSLDTLIADAARLKDVENPTLKAHIDADIAALIFAERPAELLRYNARQKFAPFSGKSGTEIMLLMASDMVTRSQKVLHANLGIIFDQLEMENASQNFYLMPMSKQRAAITKKVDELLLILENENPEPEIEIV